MNHQVIHGLANQDTITISWHIDDVLEVRPDLTASQAKEVLHHCKRFHDAEIGINWIVLTVVASELFGDATVNGD